MSLFVAGALSAGYAVAALFFGRFWRDTRERLFAFFAVAFAMLAVQRVALGAAAGRDDLAALLYGIRLLAFALILYAVIDTNRAAGRRAGRPPPGPETGNPV